MTESDHEELIVAISNCLYHTTPEMGMMSTNAMFEDRKHAKKTSCFVGRTHSLANAMHIKTFF